MTQQPELKYEIVDEPAEPQAVAKQLEDKALSVVDQVKALTIQTQEQYALMVEHLRGIKALRAAAEGHHRPLITKAHGLWKDLLGALQRVDEPLAQAEKMGKDRCLDWDRKVEAQRQEAIRKQQEELARQAREHEEAVRKAEEAARVAQEALDRQEAERMEAELEQAEARGASAAEVQAIIEQPRITPVIPVFAPAPFIAPTQFTVPEAPKAKGAGISRPWKAAVYTPSDLVRVIQYVAQHPEYSNLLNLNQSALNALAKAQGANLRIPGVRVYQDASMSIR